MVIFYEELNDVYVSNIHNLRLLGIANLEIRIAEADNYFYDATKRFCSFPAGSHLNGAFSIKSNFPSIFQLIGGNKFQLGIVYQLDKCIENCLDQRSKYVTFFLGF